MPIALFLSNWRLILEVVIVGLLVAYGITMRTERDIARAEYSEFRREVAIAAQAAAEQALKKTIADEKRKEEADADNLRLRGDLDLLTRRLRDTHSDSRFLSAATTCPSSPEEAAKYKAEYERAYRKFVSGLRDLGDECSGETIDLNTAKVWAER